jgi:hypothetical protein
MSVTETPDGDPFSTRTFPLIEAVPLSWAKPATDAISSKQTPRLDLSMNMWDSFLREQNYHERRNETSYQERSMSGYSFTPRFSKVAGAINNLASRFNGFRQNR